VNLQIKRLRAKSRVLVAMSGGVDSSVAAALLKKAGYQVTGVFMRLWQDKKEKLPSAAEKRARKIANFLKIPFLAVDFQKEFKKKIVNRFIKEYQAGRTPNPCVFCNEEIKFGLLVEKAREMGIEYVATGHYARLEQSQKSKVKSQNEKSKVKNFRLLQGKDKDKDQVYFLWRLKQEQLRRIIFPVGNYTKKEVRQMAEKFKLPFHSGKDTGKVKESQEICFVNDINQFLSRFLKPKPGKIVDATGKILGQHQGLVFYTVGQRKGIGLAGGPYFVVNKDTRNNCLMVSKNERDLYQKELIAAEINWIAEKEPKLPCRIKAKIRYRQEAVPATLSLTKNKWECWVAFARPQRAIAAGQSVVFYKGSELLGGAVIRK